jgi:hypothetical protein
MLIVACPAAAMLMLDVALVNTAIPQVAADLHAGLGGQAEPARSNRKA